MMISTAHFLTVKDIFYQRLHQTADLLDVIRHCALLDAQLVRHLLLGGSVIEQTEDPAVLRFDFCTFSIKLFTIFYIRIYYNIIIQSFQW